MNTFLKHHRDAIRFDYSCFDRMLLGGYIQALQRPGQIARFLRDRRQVENLSRAYLGGLARDYSAEVVGRAARLGVDILEPGDDRREDLVAGYFENVHPFGVAVIIKAREPERIAVSNRSQFIDMRRRWVNCYTFYIRDAHLGRMSLRVCPYFPFNVSVWLNGHEYLAQQLRQRGIAFRQCDNCFVDCEAPEQLRELAEGFGAEQIKGALKPWLAQLVPYFTTEERAQGYRHHFMQRQIEYCHNMVFHEKAAINRLFDRLLDHGRALGHPNKIAIVFGRRRFHIDARTGEIQERITQLRTPLLRAGLEKTSIKQYVREGAVLRTESTCCQLRELSLPKSIEQMPRTRKVLRQCNERFESLQQDILETYVDRGQLQKLRQPTVSASGRRLPGLRADDPRLLGLWQALLCFAHLAGNGTFKTAALLTDVQKALGNPNYKLSQLRYDLGKLRGKGLVQRLAGTQRYQITAIGYRLGVFYLKAYQRLYAPLTAALIDPLPADHRIPRHRYAKLDRLYVAIDRALKNLTKHVGIAARTA